MRIISGELKGRKIEGFNIEGTRPTMDRVKESLFGIIQNYVKDSVCLDLFGGSGNLSFEAISNGSNKCYINDNNPKCIGIIKKNVHKFNVEKYVNVLEMDYQKCLKYMKDNNIKLNIIFLDPPYKMECLNEVLSYILEKDLLTENGIIICEVSTLYFAEEREGLDLMKKKKYGDKYLVIYKKTSH